MKKTFRTSKNKEELVRDMKELQINYHKYKYDKELLFIRIEDVNKIQVSSGRDSVCWKLDFDTSGEITVKKAFSVMECILLCFFIVLDVFLFLFFIYIGDSSVRVLGRLSVLCLTEVMTYYPIYIFFPMRIIKKFVNRYLGGNA